MVRRLPILLLVLLAACSDEPVEPPLSRDFFAPLGEPVPYATAAQRADFERGRALVERIFTEAEGLGPRFNVVSCGACHLKPVLGGTSGRYRNFFLIGRSAPDGGFVPGPFAGIAHGYGLGYEAVRPGVDGEMDVAAQRNALPIFGSGLLAELPDRAILAGADPDDRDGDGISGRPNFDQGFVGRFGRKAQNVAVEGFIRGPLNNHLGITTDPLDPGRLSRLPVPSFLPAAATRGALGRVQQGQVAPVGEPLVDEDDVPDPELSPDDLFALISFSMLLAPPPPDPPTPATERGRATFAKIGCDRCHTPTLEGPRGPIPLYSDLLLHDLGPEMADGVAMGEASGAEFRTQPLWAVAAAAPYLHDGRADTLEEAIRWHGGEGSASREAFDALPQGEQAELVAFLVSLGGAAARSEGLLPQDAPVPPVGAPGGPVRTLDAMEEMRFVEGRRLFDRDTALAEGLGSPHFNADSCRACHSHPAIGGAGTLDVTVIRAGTWEGDAFTPPVPGSTILPRVSVPWVRRLEATYNVIERRKSPSILGLGLVEGISAEAIEANADPDDADGDGIRGRVSRLEDGRLGRFGWKADVPTLAEFVRDAHSNEMGFTLAPEEGLTFGASSDEDGIADPELAADPLGDMAFFLRALAPLLPTATEEQGAALFAQVGCDRCHLPSLEGVPLYSDLLLHDVAPPRYRGIPTATTGGREFRTPPLWGLSRTGPWMHDAGAPTIEAAIEAHDGEALASRQAFEALDAAGQAALLRFLEAL